MPITYQIDLSRDLIRTRARGSVTLEEVTEHLCALELDPLFRKPLDVLLDLTPCTSLPDRNQLVGVAHQLKGLGGREQFLRCAIATSRTAMFGMTRMFEVMAQDQFVATHAFRTIRDAEAWLTEGRAPALRPDTNHFSTGRAASAS
jgi:hypothetical protein